MQAFRFSDKAGAGRRSGRFSTRQEGYNKRIRIWTCEACLFQHMEITRQCEDCGSVDIHYFDSKKEANRYSFLWQLQKAGRISSLEVHPKFPIVVLDQRGRPAKVKAKYVADFAYMQDGKRMIEDVKGSNDPASLDGLFKFKRRLVEAAYGIEITIVAG